MAVICRSHKLLFIQAPRTGCTAIETLLLHRFGGESLPAQHIYGADGLIRVDRKHTTIRQLLKEELIEPDYQQRLITFTAVRNPFDSLVSLYVKKRDTYQKDLADPSSWIHRVRGYVEDMEFCRTHTFHEWLTKRYAVGALDRLMGRGRRSVYGRYTDGVSYIMRFERLQEDFEALMRQAGIDEDVTIPRVNATPERRTSYREYYTAEARRLVEYVFKLELERYGYTFDGLRDLTPRSTTALVS